jgi:chaperonin cofactor prefoldin
MKTSHIRFYISHLERQGADLETKIEELQDINQVLREKDKMKEDVIAKVIRKIGCGITID